MHDRGEGVRPLAASATGWAGPDPQALDRTGSPGHRLVLMLALLLLSLLAGGCATRPFTVDDGRKLDEALLKNIRGYGEGERRIRPAIERSAALRDAACDKQWELPFSVASAAAYGEDERVAWVRALGVDERLTVVAATARSPLQPGERIVAVAGSDAGGQPQDLLALLAERRDAGQPFQLRTDGQRSVQVRPFEVCRGYTRFSPPTTPALQDYHWLLSLHPLELTEVTLDDDEALWMVLWTQGLSEEGGARMKTFHYGTKIVGTLYNLATLASGLKGAAVAAEAAMKAAQSAAATVATELLKQQLIEQAKAFAADRLRGVVADTLERSARAMMVGSMQQAAVNRGSLGGVSRVAATVFERADAWAFQRMARLSANPLAGFALHRKLAENGFASNAIVLDVERLQALSEVARLAGLEAEVVATLRGIRPDELQIEMAAMPLASAPQAFAYDDPSPASTQPFARGLVDAMLEMPIDSKGRK